METAPHLPLWMSAWKVAIVLSVLWLMVYPVLLLVRLVTTKGGR